MSDHHVAHPRSAHPVLRRSLDEIAHPALRLAGVALVLTAAMTAVGLLLVHGPLGAVRRWDVDAMERFVTWRSGGLDRLTGWGTWLAETVPVVVITAVAAFLAWRATRRLVLPAVVLLAVGGEKLVYLVTSVVVGRDRPPVPTIGSTYATSSFPSGHVGSTVVLYGSIALVVGALTGSRAWRNGLLALTAVLAAVVGFCRMERGFHFPTDVAAGVVIGVAWLWATWHLLVRTNHDAAPPPEAPASVAWAEEPAGAEVGQRAVR